MGRDIGAGKWLEWQIQAYVVQEARRKGYTIEGDQNQGKRSYAVAARAKACGMQAGSPDLRVLLPEGKTVWIELKVPPNKMSVAQQDWHYIAMLKGHTAKVVFCCTPYEGWREVKRILEGQQ